jgi:hypothetical protein
MKRIALLGAVAAALAVFLVAGLSGCGDNELSGGPYNRRPGVMLTATPPQGDTTRYDVELHWSAWDPDGRVDHFMYCVDPPDSADADTVWEVTQAYSVRLIFTTEAYDTTTIGQYGDWRVYQVALGYHVFLIKAVDNQGAMSAPDDVAFTAYTICPRTYITSPPPAGEWNEYQSGPQPVGLRVTFRWRGEDPDGVFTDKPVAYLYKLLEINLITNYTKVGQTLLEDEGPWVRVGGETTQVTLDLENNTRYAFGVRAIDEAGAVEPLLVLNRNVLWVQARELSSFPELTLKSTAFGIRKWLGWTTDAETYEVPLGSTYELDISGDARWYGGIITGLAFGWDLATLDSPDTDPEGNGAWTPWSTTLKTITARFTQPRDYYFYIKCKDDLGGVTLGIIHFNVTELTPAYNLGYIDDWRVYPISTGEPLDDAAWQRMLDGYNYGVDWSNLVWDEWGAPEGEEIPSLEFLSQFKVIVWSLNDTRAISPVDKSAWYQMNDLNTSNVLAVYMGSQLQDGTRGKVWAYGRGMVESTVLPYGGSSCEYPYSVREDASSASCYIRARSFGYDYMHIRGDFLSSNPSSGGSRVNYFEGSNDKMQYVCVNSDTLPIPGYDLGPAAELYPSLPPRLEPDLSKLRAGGLLWFEVLEYPSPEQTTQLLFFDQWLGGATGLIPLYKYKAADEGSKADGKFCGFRYIPGEALDQGEIVYFFFPMYPIYDDQARATAKVVLSDWFGLPDPDAAASH